MGRLLSGKAAAGIISLGSIAIAARILGVEQYGVLNLVHGFATLMGGTIAFLVSTAWFVMAQKRSTVAQLHSSATS
jgi:hypothetical protein